MMQTSGTSALSLQAAPQCGLLMLTWRCRNMQCRRIILTFREYSGDYQEHRCHCRTWNILPRDNQQLTREIPKHRPDLRIIEGGRRSD